jgi:hypothetical protein
MDTPSDSEVDVQQVMREIEEQLWSQRVWEQMPTVSPELSDELQKLLQRIRELAANLYVECSARYSGVPLIGKAIAWLRIHLHSLVLYYVNDLARRETMLAFAFLQVLHRLATENRNLHTELVRLRKELRAYRVRTAIGEKRFGQYHRLRDKELCRRFNRRW